MDTNWDVTRHNYAVEVDNFYGKRQMAEVALYGGFSVGLLGKWWVPVAKRDVFAKKVYQKFSSEFPAGEVRVSFPLPDVQEAEGEVVPFASYSIPF